uniref:Nucleoside-triphosphatase, cancer-related n=1 Tax=Bos indicus x Bos taurus TaxID=30522 RepID=A0A4W2IGN0_BOBOX
AHLLTNTLPKTNTEAVAHKPREDHTNHPCVSERWSRRGTGLRVEGASADRRGGRKRTPTLSAEGACAALRLVASGRWRRGLRPWGTDPGSRPLPGTRLGDFDPTPTRAVTPTRAYPYGPARVPDWAPRSEPLPGKRECRVGQYVVDLTSFEQLALPVLRNAGASGRPGQSICVIDEVGKMELFSQPFIQAVRQVLSTPGTVVLGTIPVPKGKPLALVEEIRTRKDVKVFSVTKENRNHLLPEIVTHMQSSRK